VAVSGSGSAAPIQLASGLPVMTMGGFSGGDDAPTVAALQAYVESGELRFVLVGGGGGPGGFGVSGGSGDVGSWVGANCTAGPAALVGTRRGRFWDSRRAEAEARGRLLEEYDALQAQPPRSGDRK
jgi:hypothetical protein